MAPPQTSETAATQQVSGRSPWESRGRPHRMVTVRSASVDVVSEGRVIRHILRGGGTVTLAELDRYLPADWLTITDGTATLNATVVLTRDTTLAIGGTTDGLGALRLAGGATPADAASLHTGGGALSLTALSVSSIDPATGQPVAATAPGRPSIVASSGGRLTSTDVTISDLGTQTAAGAGGRAGVVFNPASTGSLVRTTLQRGSTGLELMRSTGVQLEDVTISESGGDGLVLSGDRGTTLSGIRTEGNGGNGVQVTGDNSDRPITGITTSGNGEFGLAVSGQTGTHITGVTTAIDRQGGLNISRSSGLVVTDFTATGQRIGVFTHVYSSGIVLDRLRITGGRWGVSIEKTTRGVDVTDSTFQGAGVAGVSIGGQQVTLSRVQVRDSDNAVRIESGASGAQLTNLAVSGGRDGVVAKPDTNGVVVTGLVADNVESDAVRTAGHGTQILGARITGGTTGIDAQAGTIITDTTITAADAGIHSRSPDLVQASGVTIDTIDIGINTAKASPFVLADSQIHALESVRGEVDYQGANDLSLPPLNVISVIGLPLIVLAVVLEEIHAARQRRRGITRRRPPVLRMGSTAASH